VVIGERHLRGILSAYVEYYNGIRTHLSLAKDAQVAECSAAESGQGGAGATRRWAPSRIRPAGGV